MTVNVSKPAINLREKLAELDKPTGIAGEAMLRAETPQEQFNLIGAGRKNWVINGNMQVSQRGDYSSATSWNSGNYYMDRWQLFKSGVSATLQQTTASIDSVAAQYAQKLVATSTATGYAIAQQKVEDYAIFADQTVTLSAWVKSNKSNAMIILYDGSWKGVVNHSGNGSWEKLETTVTLSSSLSELRVRFGLIDNAQSGTLSLTTNDYIEVANVQLELGKVATPFEHRSYGEEFALCQRYYYRIDGRTGYSILPTFGAYNANNAAGSIPFPVELRDRPTALEQSGTAGDYFLTDSSGAAQACTSVPTFGGSTHKKGASVVMTSTGNVSAGNASIPTMGANGYLAWSAEL